MGGATTKLNAIGAEVAGPIEVVTPPWFSLAVASGGDVRALADLRPFIHDDHRSDTNGLLESDPRDVRNISAVRRRQGRYQPSRCAQY